MSADSVYRRASRRNSSCSQQSYLYRRAAFSYTGSSVFRRAVPTSKPSPVSSRSEEHTSELQSLRHLVCRLLLEKKKNLAPPRSINTPQPISTSLCPILPTNLQH